jgi:Fe2+ or Zn2+ uptake regulation protein
MTLSEEAESRLADLVELQPTKNGELQERWDMDGGSEVHQYLESELEEYYYRNEDSLICATPAAAEELDVEPDDDAVRVPELQARILEVLAGPDADPQSVVSVLQDLRETGLETDTDAVRSGLRRLEDKGLVAVVEKTVPTFRLAVARDAFTVEVLDEAVEA